MNQHEDMQDSPGEPLPRPAVTAAARAREAREDAMRWAIANLRCSDPRTLEEQGVNVYFAPNLRRGVKVVSLADGRIDQFRPDEHLPGAGCFADYASLDAYCRRWGAPMQEIEGSVVVQLPPDAGDRTARPEPQD
ncbi:MAG: hypothetical protein WC273_09345 [Dehalococcoidia bacterium]